MRLGGHTPWHSKGGHRMFVSSVLADANEMPPMTGLRMAMSGPQLVILLKCEAPFPGAVITIVSYSLKPLPFLERLR